MTVFQYKSIRLKTDVVLLDPRILWWTQYDNLHMNHIAFGSEYVSYILDTIHFLSVRPSAAQHAGVFSLHVSSGLQLHSCLHLFFRTFQIHSKCEKFLKMVEKYTTRTVSTRQSTRQVSWRNQSFSNWGYTLLPSNWAATRSTDMSTHRQQTRGHAAVC